MNRKSIFIFFLIIAILNLFLQLLGNNKNMWSCIGAGLLLISALINLADYKKREK